MRPGGNLKAVEGHEAAAGGRAGGGHGRAGARAVPRGGRDGGAVPVTDVTTAYVEECRADGSRLRGVAGELRLPPTYAESYGRLLLARPIFAVHDEIAAFGDDLVALFDLLVSVPDRCFDGDLSRYCSAIHMDERLAELALIGATGRPELYARADAYHDGTAFRLLELNVGSELGGIDAAQLNRAFLDAPAFAEFAARHELAHVDTSALLADALLAAGRQVTSGDPVVALVEATGALVAHEHVFLAIREALARYGIDLLLSEIDRVTSRNGKILVDGTPVDVVLRYFATGELLDDPAGRDALELLMKAHATGTTAVYTPLEAVLFASKAAFALLHDPRLREAFTTAERDLVDRIVPWTRVIGPGWDGAAPPDQAELVDRCRAERVSLILKPGVGYGGVGAVLGREVDDAAWAEALATADGADYVVQRIVTPATEPVCNPATGEIEDWRANWGIFATRAGYGGAFVRALQAHHGSVISYSNPGTRGTCVFTHAREATS